MRKLVQQSVIVKDIQTQGFFRQRHFFICVVALKSISFFKHKTSNFSSLKQLYISKIQNIPTVPAPLLQETDFLSEK